MFLVVFLLAMLYLFPFARVSNLQNFLIQLIEFWKKITFSLEMKSFQLSKLPTRLQLSKL